MIIVPTNVVGAASDPYWSNVQLLLQGEGSNGSTSTVDSSSAARTVTSSGGASISTTRARFGSSSLLLSAASSQYFTATPNMAFGTADWTVEGWVYLTDSSVNRAFISNANNNGTYNYWALGITSGGTTAYFSSRQIDGGGQTGEMVITGTTGQSLVNTWTHLAVTRSGNTHRLFINGICVNSYAEAQNYVYSAPIIVGAYIWASYSQWWQGNIDCVRVTTGVARYTQNFVPSIVPLSRDSVPNAGDEFLNNTSLLLKTVGTAGATNKWFRDDSANNFVPVRNGDVTQGSFSPFSGYSGSGWSISLFGTNHLSTPSNTAFDHNSGDVTVEAWVYRTADDAGYQFFWGGSQPGIILLGAYNNKFVLDVYYRGSVITSPDTIVNNRWYHVAATKSGQVAKLYVDGVLKGSWTHPATWDANSTPMNIGKIDSYYWPGYVSNLRFTKSVVYTENFTPPTEPLTALANTTFLSCQSNRFVDRSSQSLTLTSNGDVAVQRFSPFPVANTVTTHLASTGSVAFDGSGDYLTVANNTALQMSTGSFTLEFWWNPTVLSGFFVTPFDKGYTSAGGLLLQSNGADRLVAYLGGSAIVTSTVAIPTSAWSHIALVRNGTTVTMYVNGAAAGSGTSSADLNSTATLAIGVRASDAAYPITGQVSNLRIVKGSAVYTSAFTPPTAPLTAITGTSLLTCQDAVTVTDASTNNFTVTRVGDAKASEVSPFKRSSSVYGGSAYFDGTGDSLSIPSNTAFEFPGDFCIEGWLNPSATTGTDRCIWETRASAADAGLVLFIDSAGKLNTYTSNALRINSTAALTANVWQHFALVRSSGVLAFYINGVQSGTLSYATSIACPGLARVGIRFDGAMTYTGYIAGFRVVKGSPVYSANFTPPSAPVTAINGTSLLLNFDNAAAFDAVGAANYSINSTARTSKTLTRYADTSIEHPDKNASANTAAVGGPLPIFALSGDFTIEFNYNPQGGYGDSVLYDHGPTSALLCVFTFANGALGLLAGGGTVVITGTTILNPSTWYHIAVTRSGTNVRLFLNGVQQGATWSSSTSFAATQPRLGSYYNGTYSTPGYYSELRVTRAARYTSNFTPPAAELPVK